MYGLHLDKNGLGKYIFKDLPGWLSLQFLKNFLEFRRVETLK